MWQLIDSAFPAGGFVHSGGIESASQVGYIRDKASLDRFLRVHLHQTAETTLSLMMRAFLDVRKDASVEENIQAFEAVDRDTQAITTNHVANRASRAQGAALLSTAASSFTEAQLTPYKRIVFSQYGHYAPVFGLVCKLLDISFETVRRMYLFITLRGLLSSAVRLNLIGPMEAQSVHFKCCTFIEQLLKQNKCVDVENIYQTAPLLDIMQGTQDRLYSRLFNT